RGGRPDSAQDIGSGVAGLFNECVRLVQYSGRGKPYRCDSLKLSPALWRLPTPMNAAIRNAYDTELGAARAARAVGNVEAAFHHLERAHILAQRWTFRHVQTHWLMLRLGASTRAWGEVIGQMTRIVAAALVSRI